MLEREGFLVTPIRPPTVPEGTARLRLAFTAAIPTTRLRALRTLCENTSSHERILRHRNRNQRRQDIRRRGARAPTACRREPVWALKPVVALRRGEFARTDRRAAGAMGHTVSPDCVARFRIGASPHPCRPTWRRARTQGNRFDALVAFCKDEIGSRRGTLVIEGVGGVMVPLDKSHTVLDWMAALGIPAILVAGTYLGSISHALTAPAR